MKTLILYYTRSGHTLEAANAVAEGIRAAGSEADVVMARDLDPASLAGYDGLIVGSPCYYGLFASGVAGPITKALQALEPDALSGKRCGGIAVQAATGAKHTVESIGTMVQEKGCAGYLPGPVATAGVPMSVVKGPRMGPRAKERFRAYGTQFAT